MLKNTIDEHFLNWYSKRRGIENVAESFFLESLQLQIVAGLFK